MVDIPESGPASAEGSLKTRGRGMPHAGKGDGGRLAGRPPPRERHVDCRELPSKTHTAVLTMDGYQRAACWIDRFASRLQEHGVLREEAIEIAAREWDDDDRHPHPETAAEALFGWDAAAPPGAR
jgi:hypothetical protein